MECDWNSGVFDGAGELWEIEVIVSNENGRWIEVEDDNRYGGYFERCTCDHCVDMRARTTTKNKKAKNSERKNKSKPRKRMTDITKILQPSTLAVLETAPKTPELRGLIRRDCGRAVPLDVMQTGETKAIKKWLEANWTPTVPPAPKVPLQFRVKATLTTPVVETRIYQRADTQRDEFVLALSDFRQSQSVEDVALLITNTTLARGSLYSSQAGPEQLIDRRTVREDKRVVVEPSDVAAKIWLALVEQRAVPVVEASSGEPDVVTRTVVDEC